LPASAAPSLKGVLGNFSSKVSHEKLGADDVKKGAYLQTLIKRFNDKTPKTKEHTQKYRQVLADNRNSAGFRPNTKEMIYPIICHRAKGSRFHDYDGNEFVDFTMGFGVNLFGHSPDFVEDAIRKQFELGLCIGPQSFLAGEVARLIAQMTGQPRVAFCNSGTEAVMTAIRLARAATKRSKIVIFEGSYHGHFDGVLARSTPNHQTIPVAPGVTQGFAKDVLVLEYGSKEALEMIRREGKNLAAVIVEPVQSRFPEHQPSEFLRELRQITAQNGTAFVWDEVITGFRIKPGGAQSYFGIKADLASYGKILGGGLPIGAIAGEPKYLDAIDGGMWNFGDDSFPQGEMTFFAGTFSKHPFAMAAAYAVLKKLEAEGDQILEELNRRTTKLAQELTDILHAKGLDLHVNNFGSLFRFKGTGNLDLFFLNLNLKDIYVWEGRNLFLSTAHTDEDLARFKKAVSDSADELIESGHFKSKFAAPTTTEDDGEHTPVTALLLPSPPSRDAPKGAPQQAGPQAAPQPVPPTKAPPTKPPPSKPIAVKPLPPPKPATEETSEPVPALDVKPAQVSPAPPTKAPPTKPPPPKVGAQPSKPLPPPKPAEAIALPARMPQMAVPSIATGEKHDLLITQKRFQRLTKEGGESASHICVAVKMKGPLQKDWLKQSLEAALSRFDG
ncbi:MAG: aspartate aminotransferase family protein, partial [Bdellovibrionia bacterium]